MMLNDSTSKVLEYLLLNMLFLLNFSVLSWKFDHKFCTIADFFSFSYNIHQLPMQKGFICSRIWNESKIYKVAYDRKISRRIVGWINIVVSLTWSLYYVRNQKKSTDLMCPWNLGIFVDNNSLDFHLYISALHIWKS